MRLNELKGSYDSIFSLGQNCLPAIQLQKNHLRFKAGVLDWMISDTLADVNRLLKNRFAGFMDFSDLDFVNYNVPSPQNLYVKDLKYNVISAHDFPTSINTTQNLVSYPEVIEKYNRRIKRFLEEMEKSKRTLFIRMQGTLEETRELHCVLNEMVKYEFNILLVNPTEVKELIELDWPLEKVCVVEVPSKDIWGGNSDYLWSFMFKNINR
jgi:hypothetical protein